MAAMSNEIILEQPINLNATNVAPSTVYSGTIEVDSTITGDAGTDAEVTNEGTLYAARFKFTIPKGDSSTITINSVTTGAPGTDVIIEDIGTPGAAIWNIAIPRGDVGAKGDKGDQGDKGDNAQSQVGIATTSTNPGTILWNTIYIAGTIGTYTYFLDSGGSPITTTAYGFLVYNGTYWAFSEVLASPIVLAANMNANSKRITSLSPDLTAEGDAVNVAALKGATENWPLLKTAAPSGALTATQIRDFLVDMYLIGTPNPALTYSAAIIERNNGGAWSIKIYSATGSPGSVVKICELNTGTNPESGDNITFSTLSEVGGSGVTGRVAVRWSKIPVGIYINMYYSNGYGLDPFVWDYRNSVIARFAFLVENLNANSKKITSLGTPTLSGDAVNKGYVDPLIDDKLNRLNFMEGEFIEYQHARGVAEEVGDADYTMHGVGCYCQVGAVAIEVNRIRVKAGSATTGTTTYIKVYQSATKPTTFIPDTDFALLYSGSQVWTGSTADRVIELPEILTIPANYYVYILYSSLTSVDTKQRRWTADPNGDRMKLALCVSTDYANIFTKSWQFGGTGYWETPPVLYMDSVYAKETTVDTLQAEVTALTATVAAKSAIYLPRITIPATIYAAVGVELNLYYDALVLPIDRGLQSPLNTQVEIICAKGDLFERKFTFTPVSGDVGTYSMVINVYNCNKTILQTKTVSLIVVAATAPSAVKYGVMVGDSLTNNGPITSTIQTWFAALGSNLPIFVGFKGTSPANHEGYPGWTFALFTSGTAQYYKFQVSGVTSVVYPAVYSNNGSQFTVIRTKTAAGSGYIECSRTSGTNAPLASGTLTKVSGSGDATITYSSYAMNAQNPFWNTGTGLMDIANYRSEMGMGATLLDFVTIQLGVNDCGGAVKTEAAILTIIAKAKLLIDAFLADNAACKIIVELPTIDGNTKGGWGTNYGATDSKEAYQTNLWRFRELVISNFDVGAYNANVSVGIAGLGIDRYYGYELDSVAISARDSSTELIHINAAHPITSGYEQIGDSIYPQLLQLLQ
jgi:hypothetical protein